MIKRNIRFMKMVGAMKLGWVRSSSFTIDNAGYIYYLDRSVIFLDLSQTHNLRKWIREGGGPWPY